MLFAHPGAWVKETPEESTDLFSAVLLPECLRFIRRRAGEKHVYHTAAVRCRALPLILEAILAADRDTPLCHHLLAPFFDALAEELRAETATGRLSRREQEWKRLQEYIALNLARDVGRRRAPAESGHRAA